MNRAWSLSKPPFEAIARHLKTCRGQRCRHPVQLRGCSAAAPVLSIFHRGQLTHLNCAPLWRKRSRLSQLLHLNADAS